MIQLYIIILFNNFHKIKYYKESIYNIIKYLNMYKSEYIKYIY